MGPRTLPRASYENVEVDCESCHRNNIFNRVSDLGEVRPIAHKVVACLYCRAPLHISCDLAATRYEMLLYDCDQLLSEKRYAYCVLNAAQAVEAFVSHFLRIELAIKPFWRESRRDFERANSVMTALFEAIKRYGFWKLRNIFLNWHLCPRSPDSLSEAEALLQQLPSMAKKPPGDADLAALPDKQLAGLLRALKESRAHELRNKVVHEHCYRPTRAEAERLLEQVRDILFPLAWLLKVKDDDFGAYQPGA